MTAGPFGVLVEENLVLLAVPAGPSHAILADLELHLEGRGLFVPDFDGRTLAG
jgi:hypothetical protein